jgi:hypothetical protein
MIIIRKLHDYFPHHFTPSSLVPKPLFWNVTICTQSRKVRKVAKQDISLLDTFFCETHSLKKKSYFKILRTKTPSSLVPKPLFWNVINPSHCRQYPSKLSHSLQYSSGFLKYLSHFTEESMLQLQEI